MELQKEKALAGLGFVTLTAGGDFHPALRTSAVRDGRPATSMAKGRVDSKRLPMGKAHVPMTKSTMMAGRSAPA
jgi:hypothetical protein